MAWGVGSWRESVKRAKFSKTTSGDKWIRNSRQSQWHAGRKGIEVRIHSSTPLPLIHLSIILFILQNIYQVQFICQKLTLNGDYSSTTWEVYGEWIDLFRLESIRIREKAGYIVWVRVWELHLLDSGA